MAVLWQTLIFLQIGLTWWMAGKVKWWHTQMGTKNLIVSEVKFEVKLVYQFKLVKVNL